MRLNQHPAPFQQKVIVRLWLALGIKAHELADDAVEELLAEWQQELAEFTLEQIDRGRLEAVKRPGTLPADQFRALCLEEPAPQAEETQAPAGGQLSDTARQELDRMRALFGDPAGEGGQ